MMKRLAAIAATILIGLAAWATPAQAAPIYGCPDAYVCLYSDDSYNGGQYKFHVQNLFGGVCWSLPWSGQAGWPGGATANQVSSIILNRTQTSGSSSWIAFYDDNYCTHAGWGTFRMTAPGQVTLMYQMHTNPYPPDGPGQDWNDRIGSIRLNGS